VAGRNERLTIVLKDVERLNTTNFMAGNVILDAVVVKSADLKIGDTGSSISFSPHRQNSPNSFSGSHSRGGF
jgi:hypothetical protein